MADIVFVGIVVVFFGLVVGFVEVCTRIVGSGSLREMPDIGADAGSGSEVR